MVGRVGRFIPLPDSDNDGIPNEIDLNPGAPSDQFNFETTSGTIDRGDQEVGCAITRAPDGDGVGVPAA